MGEVMRVPYTSIRNAAGETLLRPLVTLLLSRDANTFSASGLLDTGADVNVLPYHIGQALGGRLVAGKNRIDFIR